MVADDNSAMGNYIGRQKWMQDLFKPAWAISYEPSWIKAVERPRFAFNDFTASRLVSADMSNALTRINGASAISRDLTSGLTGSRVDPLGISKMSQGLVASLFGSPGISNTTRWAVKSAISDIAGSHRSIFDDINESMPKLVSPALGAIGKAQFESWALAGAHAIEDYSPEPIEDEITVSVTELEQREVDETFAELIERVREVEKQQESHAANSGVMSEQVEAIYQKTVADAPADRRSDRQFQVIVALLAFLLGYLASPPGAPEPVNDPPRVEAPGVLASSNDVPLQSDPAVPVVDAATAETPELE